MANNDRTIATADASIAERHSDRVTDVKRPSGPTADEVEEARQEAANALLADPWETPPVSAVRTLKHAEDRPHVLDGDGGRSALIEDARITEGDPLHGAHMSTAHVSRLVAQIPKHCPQCRHDRAQINMRRHHNIAGGHTVECTHCGHVHDSRTWG